MSSNPSSPSILAISTEQLKALIDRRTNGTPPGEGWGVYEIDCPACEAQLTVVAMIGTRGLHCPKCNSQDMSFAWLSNAPNGGDLNFLNPVAFNKTDFLTRN